MDKSRIGLICISPRATRERQEEALRKAGAEWIVEIGRQHKTWRDAVSVLRPGDVLDIYALSLLPTKRGADDLTPTAQLGEILIQVHDRGAELREAYTGRSSRDKKQRQAMVKDAQTALRRGSRALPDIGRGRGRPAKEFPADVLAEAKRVWFSRDYATNLAAVKHLPQGVNMKWAFRLFGASGRPYKSKKR
jgi:hypothetical protein